jgi:hypothetical protein
MKRIAGIATLIAAGVLLACGAAYIAPDVGPDLVRIAQGQDTGTTQEALQRGHDTFVANCDRCHKLPAPTRKTPEQWPATLDVMANRAKLTEEQERDVLRFILAARELPKPSADAGAR